MRTMDRPGLWAGGFRAWDARGVYLATGRAASPGQVLRVPAPALRALADRWFPLGVHLIEGLYGTVRTMEVLSRQRESLVALGTLAAGLAHEINNPAAAAIRAVETLGDASGYLLDSLTQLSNEAITTTELAALDSFRRELQRDAVPRDPLALADAEEDLTDWLERHGVDEAWQLAPALVAGGADAAWGDRLAKAISPKAMRPGLSWITSALSVEQFLGELRDSTQRISGLVAAVKSYSQMDRASRQHIAVTDGIDSSITILGHKLHDGITVQREYDAVPEIDAYAGELNQVWTNLIDNAVDAMPDKGTLTITVRSDASDVVVEIKDTGPGMPTETLARAFEAFYTTKEVGKGTGLGLDIARRIVEDRHSGSISIDSSPDGTTLQVRLPTRAS